MQNLRFFHKNELAYSLMCKFLEEQGIPGTNTRASKFFKLLRESGFMILRHKYYHDPASGYRHGNFFVLSPGVTKDQEEKKERKSLLYLSRLPSSAMMMTTWNCCICGASGAMSASRRGWHYFSSKNGRHRDETR